jgi:hypothetical protein
MHKYLPRVHILQTTDLQTPPEQQASADRAVTYSFAETSFTTVTAYQNQQVSMLETLHKFSNKRRYYTIIVPTKCTSLLKAQDITICTFLSLYS